MKRYLFLMHISFCYYYVVFLAATLWNSNIKGKSEKSVKTKFNFETKNIKLLPMIHTIQIIHDNIISCICIKSSHYREIEIPRFRVLMYTKRWYNNIFVILHV